jgi:hypothetical protein
VEELETVRALRKLSVFDADQEAAYREHFAEVAAVLGADVETRLGSRTVEWAASAEPGLRILTGNAGTGKTAVAESFCRACSAKLPGVDELTEISDARWVVKDLSGLADADARASTLRRALELTAEGSQVLICANEGVLRDAAEQLGEQSGSLAPLLEAALRDGAAMGDSVTIINVNRQRPTSSELWQALLHYVSRPELWESGCEDCPIEIAGCPMRQNAAALRLPAVREGLQALVRLASGEAVPTLREVLAILAWAIVGDTTCQEVKRRARDQARSAFTADDSYFARALGHGLALEAIERSPLLSAMRASGLGQVADLQVDEWLRDTTNAPEPIRRLAGAPPGRSDPGMASDPLSGTASPHDRVRTEVGTMTFHALGETVATGEDPDRVDAGLEALVGGQMPRQALWRRRVFFEEPDELGGRPASCARLLDTRFLADLTEIAETAADGGDTMLALTEIVRGLNFLTCGFSSPNEGLIVPDQACLFARDPGSFRPARPSLVQAQIPLERLSLRPPDRGLVRDLVDVDYIDVDLVVNREPERKLRLRPRLYEAIRQAAAYQGPVGQGIAEMADVRSFYGELAAEEDRVGLRVADPAANPPALRTIRLPHFEGDA